MVHFTYPFVLKDPSTLDVSSSSTTLIGGTVGGVIVAALLVVAAVVLLVMLLKRKRMSYKLSGNENGLGISNAVYGGKETKLLLWLPAELFYWQRQPSEMYTHTHSVKYFHGCCDSAPNQHAYMHICTIELA